MSDETPEFQRPESTWEETTEMVPFEEAYPDELLYETAYKLSKQLEHFPDAYDEEARGRARQLLAQMEDLAAGLAQRVPDLQNRPPKRVITVPRKVIRIQTMVPKEVYEEMCARGISWPEWVKELEAMRQMYGAPSPPSETQERDDSASDR
jgi:hypothetical protein